MLLTLIVLVNSIQIVVIHVFLFKSGHTSEMINLKVSVPIQKERLHKLSSLQGSCRGGQSLDANLKIAV